MLDHDSFRSHLASVARCLRDGGVYFIETNHPKDPLGVEETTETSWSVELDDSIVHVTFGLEGDVFDPVTQVTQTTVRLVQTRGEEVLVEFEEVCPTKVYLFQELLALLAGSPFKLAGCWGGRRDRRSRTRAEVRLDAQEEDKGRVKQGCLRN